MDMNKLLPFLRIYDDFAHEDKYFDLLLKCEAQLHSRQQQYKNAPQPPLLNKIDQLSALQKEIRNDLIDKHGRDMFELYYKNFIAYNFFIFNIQNNFPLN